MWVEVQEVFAQPVTNRVTEIDEFVSAVVDVCWFYGDLCLLPDSMTQETAKKEKHEWKNNPKPSAIINQIKKISNGVHHLDLQPKNDVCFIKTCARKTSWCTRQTTFFVALNVKQT
jgi:hypothetical protein